MSKANRIYDLLTSDAEARVNACKKGMDNTPRAKPGMPGRR